MKFLLIMYGLNAANSTFACLWCKCPSDKFYVINHNKWTISDTMKGARCLKEAHNKYNPKSKDSCGYQKEPLSPIEFVRAVIDMLHMWLRITDKLEDKLVEKIIEHGN